jgi:AraC family transcriptional regulator
MNPRIAFLKPKKLIGIHMQMSLSNDKTTELWQRFMPRREEIKNRLTTDVISMQNYGENWQFLPDSVFEKWASAEVSSFAEVPPEMDAYLLTGGPYAVFIHRGPASAAAKTMRSIFGQWLPKSTYVLDSREHFEILPKGYSPLAPDAREEIWIPIKK